MQQTAAVASRRSDFGTSCPEVSACDEILQGVFQRVEPVHEPVSDGRDAKGRNEERQHKEHHAAQRLAADEQDKGQQGQHHAAYMTQRRSHAIEKRHDGNEQGQRHHKGGGKDFENDHISYLP